MTRLIIEVEPVTDGEQVSDQQLAELIKDRLELNELYLDDGTPIELAGLSVTVEEMP